MAKRRIPIAEGDSAVAAWLEAEGGEAIPRPLLATAVRYGLEELATLAPGRSVEVRVPPFGAVQCVAGTTHRRGTPPAVIELDAATFMALAVGRLSWDEALETPSARVSGERTDLSDYLPLFSPRAPQ